MATVTLAFYAQFTASKAGANSLSVTVDLERITRADGTRSALRTGVATNITIGRRGLYGYYETGCDLDLYDYVATFITADTSVDLKEVPALWTYWISDIGDAAVASVTGAVGSVTGNVGGNVAGSVGSVTSPVTVGTNSDKTGYALTAAYDAAKTAASSADYTTARAAKLDNLDATTSSRLAASSYTAPDNADILLIKAKTDNLPSDPASNTQVNTRLATSGYTAPPTAAAITNAVLDEATASHQTAGSVGKAITDAGGAGDPLSTALNTYPSGSYGALLNNLNPQHVTLVSPVSQSGTAEVVRGMDYSASDGLALDWTFSANPDLTGASVALYIYSGATLEATWTPTVVTPTAGAGKVRVQATNAQTGALRETTYAFAIWATLASARKVQLYAGTLVVLPELRP